MGLSANIRRVPELVWRVGCETLRNLKRNHKCIVQFFKYVFMICYPYKEEILLDFAMYLIQEQQEITEAHELIRGKCGNKPFSENRLLQAYLGLFEYVTWNSKLTKEKQLGFEQDVYINMNTEKSKQISYHGNKALGYFENLVETDGLWDIFVTRQVELLVYYGKVDEARKTLEKYLEKNPENPNAHRYLYHFLKKQGTPKAELLGVLEKLFAVDPTSELVKEYTELLQEDGQLNLGDPKYISRHLHILFNKLDHYACRNSLNGWTALAQILKLCYHGKTINKDFEHTIKECWEERADWWPQYHFQEQQLLTMDSTNEYDWNIVLEKAKVAQRLLGKDCVFVKAVHKLKKVKSKKHADESMTTDPSQNETSHLKDKTVERHSKTNKRKTKHAG
ncbi:TATA box-binding protein-associated factor RNA polymerase I subunit A-like, partial [Actinia tenebrosa]|uniref:TATA box-binding protein-associated factor RNA polymerase I subunit A-like n=1 Tax=Actinia tenebrosa TaxID=6105 RepID=A0A6P8IU39_ACTTE